MKYFGLLKKNKIANIVVVNVLIVTVLLLLFRPAFKCDDYYMASIVYGVYSNVYDPHILYMNAAIGKLICFLLTIFPQVAWYTIIQLIACEVAIFTIMYILWEKFDGFLPYLFIFAIIIQYECTINITFTKTAGLLYASGLLVLLKVNEKTIVKETLYGSFLFLIAEMFRPGLFLAELGFYFAGSFIVIIRRFMKKDYSFLKYYFIKILVCTAILIGAAKGLDCLDNYIYSTENEWKTYHADNSKKATITDFSGNRYEEKKEAYEKIDCTENDIIMLQKNNLYYKNSWEDLWINNILDIYSQKENTDNTIGQILNVESFRDFLVQFFNSYMHYYFISIIILLYFIVAADMRNIDVLIVLISALVLENYYLYVNGRVFQKHIDFDLIVSLTVLLFLLSHFVEKKDDNKYKLLIICFIVCIFITIESDDLIDGRYQRYGDFSCDIDLGKEYMEYISNDKAHLYITTSEESVYSMWCYSPYEVMPKGELDNVFFMGEYLWPSIRSLLYNYDVENPLVEIVDSETILFFISDTIEIEEVSMMETYCQEHVNANAKFEKVDEYKSLNIYKCTTK